MRLPESGRFLENVTAIDPQLFASVSEYVEAVLAGKSLGKITPLEVAAQLERWAAREAERSMKAAMGRTEGGGSAGLRRAEVDVAIAVGMGMFFSEKLRAAVAYGVFERTGHGAARERAIDLYRKGREAWAAFLPMADASYVRDLSFGAERQLRGRWRDRLAEIDADIAGLQSREAKRGGAVAPDAIEHAMSGLDGAPRRLSVEVQHRWQRRFRYGAPIDLAIVLPRAGLQGRVWYRHVNQGEVWRSVAMVTASQTGSRLLTASIPAEYTQTAFPVQYYFEVSGAKGELSALVPGFRAEFCGQPYFVTEPVNRTRQR